MVLLWTELRKLENRLLLNHSSIFVILNKEDGAKFQTVTGIFTGKKTPFYKNTLHFEKRHHG